MDPFLDSFFGNPSSIHSWGQKARAAVDKARGIIAKAIGANSNEIIFTSGGTEANNLALMGVAQAYQKKGKNHLITSQVEHYAILKTCEALEEMGFDVTYLPVDGDGAVDVKACREAITPYTSLISIMYGNNEVGTKQPLREIGELAKEKGVFFHTDAIQALGVEDIKVRQIPVDLLSLSSHKINGPKGIGALYVSKDVQILPCLYGGVQERNRRAGTENVSGIVGFGKATQLAEANRVQYKENILLLRETFLSELDNTKIDFCLNGSEVHFLPHILNISFLGLEAETLLMNLDLEGVACSSGSTCTSGVVGISHVLNAMHLSVDRSTSAIRFSFGRGNTVAEVKDAVHKIAAIIKRLKIER